MSDPIVPPPAPAPVDPAAKLKALVDQILKDSADLKVMLPEVEAVVADTVKLIKDVSVVVADAKSKMQVIKTIFGIIK